MSSDTMEMATTACQSPPPTLTHRDSDYLTSLKAMGVDITDIKRKHESTEELLPRETKFTEETFTFYQDTQSLPPQKITWWDKTYMLRELWDPSWNMYIFFSAGVCFAVGHHFFYRSLQGSLVRSDEQLTNMRYGTALAFAAKSSFVAGVLSAFREQLWAAASSKFLRVVTLDDMFAAPETPLSLFNWEFIWKAKIAAALILFCWISPLGVILTTNTLATVSAVESQNTTCPGVRTLNFRFEDQTDWRNGGKILDLAQQSLSYWNNTRSNKSDPYFFDYFTAPSDNTWEIMRASTFLQGPVTDQENTFAVCERGWNCSVEISFVGPAYKCQEISRGVGKTGVLRQSTGVAVPPFSTDLLAPTGNYTYVANTEQGIYAFPQMAKMEKGGIPVMDPPFPKHLGAFRTEPIIWLGYSEFNEDYVPQYLNESTSVQNDKAFTPVLVACEHYEANYTAEIVYSDGMQLPKIKKREFLAPVINTTFLPDVEVDDGTMDKTVAVPESNYVLPQDIQTYRRTAAYHSMGIFIRWTLNGTMKDPGKVDNTRAILTNLFDHRFHFARRNIVERIEDWYGNLLTSMFARPRFQAVVWAAKTSEQTGTRTTGTGDPAEYLYPCTRTRPAVRYHYRVHILVTVYGILVLLALLGIMIGALAIRRNGGVSRDTRFSSIVQATRGPTLDKVDWGQAGAVSKEMMVMKLGYGLLETQSAHGRKPRGFGWGDDFGARSTGSKFGFGFEGEVDQLRGRREARD